MHSPRALFSAVAAALACSLLLASPSHSQSPPSSSASGSTPSGGARLQSTAARAVDKLSATIAKYGGKVGVSVLDLDTGQTLAAVGDHDALNPASNMKLLTAATALSQLSGSHRYGTALYGRRNGSVVEELVLRGHGDPSLTTADLWEMAGRLKQSGVRKVQGDILVDQSHFDEAWLPPGFDQQPNEWAYFRAPVSAVSLNRNVVTLSVWPTTKAQAATSAFDPPGYVDVSGAVKTSDADTAQSVTLLLVPNGPRLMGKVGGAIPQDTRSMSFPKRVDNPQLLAGFALRALLAEQGIAVAGGVRAGGEKARDLLALHHSRPLSELLFELGKESDNFYAETIFKTLGSKDKGRGLSAADGAEVVLRYLKSVNALDDGTVIKSGSGLFDTNRVTANTLVRVLRAAWIDPAIASEYVAQLAVGGVDGTLHSRFASFKKLRAIRAKTGTLTDVTSLSGYVLGTPGHRSIAFSIIVNGVAGKVTGARAAVDRCVSTIARAALRTKASSSPSEDDE